MVPYWCVCVQCIDHFKELQKTLQLRNWESHFQLNYDPSPATEGACDCIACSSNMCSSKYVFVPLARAPTLTRVELARATYVQA